MPTLRGFFVKIKIVLNQYNVAINDGLVRHLSAVLSNQATQSFSYRLLTDSDILKHLL